MKSRLNHWVPSATSFIISLHRHLQQNQFLLALQLSPMKWPIHVAVFFLAAENPLKTKLSNLTYSNQNPPPRMPSWQIKDWTNPFEKYIQVKLDHFPKFWGEHQNIFSGKSMWDFFLFLGEVGATVSSLFLEGIIFPPLSMGETICGLHVKSNRLIFSSPFSAWTLGVFHVFLPQKEIQVATGPIGAC